MVDWMDRRSWVCRWGLMTIPATVVVESNFHACGSQREQTLMARTMVANLTGARLREVDHELPMIRGVDAVDAYLKAHPHEARILQHLFDQRRAGRPVPSLARINRVMIWSDGEMEFRLNAPPTAADAPPRSDGRSGLVSAASGGGRDGRGRPGWTGGQSGAQRPNRPGDRRGTTVMTGPMCHARAMVGQSSGLAMCFRWTRRAAGFGAGKACSRRDHSGCRRDCGC